MEIIQQGLASNIMYGTLFILVFVRTIIGIVTLKAIQKQIPDRAECDYVMNFNNYHIEIYRTTSIILMWVILALVLIDELEIKSGYPLLFSIIGASSYNVMMKSYIDYEGLKVNEVKTFLVISYVFVVAQLFGPFLYENYINIGKTIDFNSGTISTIGAYVFSICYTVFATILLLKAKDEIPHNCTQEELLTFEIEDGRLKKLYSATISLGLCYLFSVTIPKSDYNPIFTLTVWCIVEFILRQLKKGKMNRAKLNYSITLMYVLIILVTVLPVS